VTDEAHPPGDSEYRPDPDEEVPPAPWSFKIMVVLAVLYLGWRLVQGVIWVFDKIF
jgi:hypothetical protein